MVLMLKKFSSRFRIAHNEAVNHIKKHLQGEESAA